ncbi:DUF2934 domain-containing protein [uncultured Methylobacterium sp.]|uniref:DUF2934 domain-containing protein n=1 Tax=uncultured Methylobacterium sp. TaxID=157278 RepID=UPI0035C961E4
MISTTVITFEQIRERAYELWDRTHRPDGLDIQFWLLAERELKAVAAQAPAGAETEAGSHAGSGSDAANLESQLRNQESFFP